MPESRVNKYKLNRREVFENHPDWSVVQFILKKLLAAGFEAYLAGGCVRDLLRGVVPKDFDVASSATPDEVETLFEKTISVGKKFGVIVVVHEDVSVEVARFRADLGVKNNRHPESIQFSSPREDALRRDLTINALFFDLQKSEVIDYVGGYEDLQQKLLRTVGEPQLRFEEDHLRVLRVLRFYSEFSDFEIETKTQEALQIMGPLATSVSPERFRAEWGKLLTGSRVQLVLQYCLEKTLLSSFFPTLKLNALVLPQVFVGELEPWVRFAFWALLSGSAPDLILSELKKLKFSNFENRKFERSLEVMIQTELRWEARAAAYQEMLNEGLLQVYNFWAQVRAQAKSASVVWLFEKNRKFPSLPKALVSAADVPGGLQGPKLGEALRRAYQIQLEDESLGLTRILDQIKKEFP